MIEELVRKTVLLGVQEYNLTMWGRNGMILRRNTHDEKRGIVYNSLRRSFRTWIPTYRIDDYIDVSAISCYFREDCTLQRFIVRDIYGRSWNMDNDQHIISQLISKYGHEGFLNNVIKTDISNIKDFKFHF